MKFMMILVLLLAAISAPPYSISAEELNIDVKLVNESGVENLIGSIIAKDGADGLVLTPNLNGLTPGAHGFHVHEKGNCSPDMKDGKMTAAQGAGGHYDPLSTTKHAGPTGAGHKGDLPALIVEPDGKATKAIVAPHLKIADIRGRSIIVHAGGDNYSDDPKPLGGGGARVACGIIPG